MEIHIYGSWLVWLAVAGNLLSMASCIFAYRRSRRALNRLEEITERGEALNQDLAESSFYHCATRGHDIELDVLTLDDQQPPEFNFTHIVKLTCKRCEFMQQVQLRYRIHAPGIQHINVTGAIQHLEPEPEG